MRSGPEAEPGLWKLPVGDSCKEAAVEGAQCEEWARGRAGAVVASGGQTVAEKAEVHGAQWEGTAGGRAGAAEASKEETVAGNGEFNGAQYEESAWD